MDIYAAVYDFAASAGALEGYVYHKRDTALLDTDALPVWIDNLCEAYARLPDRVREVVQPGCDQTLGRAVLSLSAILGADHPLVERLGGLVKGRMPDSPDAFDKDKWFREEPPGASPE